MSSQYLNDDLSALDYVQKDYLRGLQLERLRKMVQHAYDHVELFNSRMKERNLVPADVKSLGDIAKLPFMVKADLRDTYPFGLFAVPMSEVVRLHASSGTTGKPIVVGYTRSDLEVWMEVVKRAFASCGLTRDDVIQVSYGYGLFTGGLGAHYGAEALGATVVPTSGGNTQRQIMLMRDFGTTAVCCTPSYFNFMIEQALAQGIDMRDLPIKAGIFGAEPWTEEMRKRIEAASGIKAYDIYGLSEIIGPGVAGECAARTGMHIQEDNFLVECLNPNTLEPVAEGEEGELVITSLTKEACPIIRYRTRDLARLYYDQCPCGRTTIRMSRVKGRSDDMMIIRGVNVFPTQIEEALLRVDGTAPHFMIELTRPGNLDEAVVKVEIREQDFSDKMEEMHRLRDRIGREISSITGIHFTIELVEPNTLERFTGKAKRVLDLRNLKC